MAESAAQTVNTSNQVSSVDLVRSMMSGGSNPLQDLQIASTRSSTPESDTYIDDSKLMSIESSSREVQDQPSEASTVPDNNIGDASSEADISTEQQPNLDVETIRVPNRSGKGKVDVELNFSDRDSIKKLVTDRYNFENGFRKITAERDQLVKQQETQSKIVSSFNALDKAYQTKGVQGVIDLLEAPNGGYNSWISKEIEKQEFRKYATPDQLKAMDAQDSAAKYQQEMDRLTKENEQLKSGKGLVDKQAELKSLEAEISPIASKYSFKGKLGDSADEAMFDKMLWRTVRDNLNEEYGEEQDIPLEDVEHEFKSVAATIRNRLQKQTEKKVTKVIEQKKREAVENAQASIKSEYSNNDVALRAEAEKMLTGGNLAGLIGGWKKYSSVFGK